MAENTEYTLSAYKGPEFQQRLMWQLLVEPEFAEKTIPNLAIEYFDDPNLKRLFIIILEYFKKYEKVPNLQNQSIHQAINELKTPNNVIEEEQLFSVIKRIELWNERIINKQMLYDGDVVQKTTNEFIKQQEYRKLAEGIIDKVKTGAIRSKYEIVNIETTFQKIQHIGEEEDDCEDVTEGIDKALRKEFRETIPTGIGVIDTLTGGGLGKGEIGVILTPSGVGKTTALTIIANTALECEKNVAQIVFEDTKEQIKRKHYTIWAKSALSRLNEDEENERVNKITHEKAKAIEGKGRIVIKRFSQENTTMMDVKNWMIGYQKKFGFKFDILVLDYLDCLESHKKSPDRNEAELAIVKAFEALASDFDIPAWTAIQSNRSGFGAEFVEAGQSGGSIKRLQKAHFFMSVAKTKEQQEANFANIRILKARFAKDGQTFEDCIFNNDTMQIIINDPKYPVRNTLKHYTENDIEKVESTANKIHVALSEHTDEALINKVNTEIPDTVRDVANLTPAQINELLQNNKSFEEEKHVEPPIVTSTVEPIIEPIPIVTEPTVVNTEPIPIVIEPIIVTSEIVTKTENDEPSDYIKQLEREIEAEIHGVPVEKIVSTYSPLSIVKENEPQYTVKEKPETILEIEGAVEGASEGANSLPPMIGLKLPIIDEKDPIFEMWGGESGKTTNEVVNQPEVKLSPATGTIEAMAFATRHEMNKEKTEATFIHYEEKELPKMPLHEIIMKKSVSLEADKLLLIDPDEDQEQEKSIKSMLDKLRKNQDVIKNE